MKKEKILNVNNLGEVSYRTAWDLQKSLQQLLIDQKRRLRDGDSISDEKLIHDMLLFVEHPHVYTLGKSGDSAHLLKAVSELSNIEAEYVETDRGGDITYHGPGQIVGYPILDLDGYFTDIHKYLRYLEEVIIRTCAEYGISAGRIDGLTGVWVEDEKICAMGIRCSRWVTMHGFALNVNTDLNYFNHIVPCGISNKAVTSLEKILGDAVDPAEVRVLLMKHFSEVFGVDVKYGLQKPEPLKQFSYLRTV
ncbi:lipoyl(octanoyl) transferase LipB [Rhodohalobacter mucosus]|uniref:Octanoyltransferase n=1 Tax=Rhodohalobacter mucosus TaxID=2079485 RepID=A0A316U089_9BACT|nr:lipoyl(octanoyl) transferase LipB [Rhodohalobacter mucosus]PWN06056.1 lipoyl(octanoyl) transferase [Rhodohalobacter mucosus]